MAIREMLDPRETKGRVEWRARMAHLVWLEYPEKWDRAVSLDLGALMAYLVLLAFLGLRAPQDLRGMRVLLVLQGHLVRPGTKDQWGHQVRLAHLVLLARQDQEESLVFLACHEQTDCQGRTETLGVQAPRETRDPRVTRAPLAFLDQEGLRGILEKEVNRETKEKREKLVWMVRREIWVPKEKEAFQAQLENKGLRVHKDLKEQKVLLVKLEPLGLLVTREPLVHLALLVILVVLEKKEIRERKERTEHLEARASVVKMDYKGKEDNLVQEDSGVVWEDLVVLASLAPRETLGSLGHLALWESKEFQGLKAPGVLPEKLVYLVFLERMA